MFTSWSEQSTPAELSIASVLILSACTRVLDSAERRDTEVAALTDHASTQVGAVHAHRVVGLVADVARRTRCAP